MRIFVPVIIVALFLCNAAFGETSKPRYQFDIKGGIFLPQLDDWAQYYGHSYAPTGGLAATYALIPQLKFGLETAYVRDSGTGNLPINQATGGDVLIEYFPVWATVTLAARFTQRQWLVPYVSAGYGAWFYSQHVSGQGATRGRTWTTEYRGGIQFVLDGLDRDAMRNLKDDFSVAHVYLFVEYVEIEAKKASVELGGNAYLGGLGFDFY